MELEGIAIASCTDMMPWMSAAPRPRPGVVMRNSSVPAQGKQHVHMCLLVCVSLRIVAGYSSRQRAM